MQKNPKSFLFTLTLQELGITPHPLCVGHVSWLPSKDQRMEKRGKGQKEQLWDFPGGPVVRTSPSYVGGAGSISGEAKIPRASGPKNQNIKQKQYCYKFSKDFKNDLYQKRLKKNKKRNRVASWCRSRQTPCLPGDQGQCGQPYFTLRVRTIDVGVILSFLQKPITPV